MTLQQ